MDDPKPRPFLSFLTCLAVVLLLFFAGLVGYYSAACSDGNRAIGAAVLLMMFGLLGFPVAGTAALGTGVVVAFIGSVFLQPARSIERFGATCLASAALAAVILVASGKIASAADAYARCGIGF